jgi:CubicO group peptidase (beta-lactamase class C family)
MVFCQSREKDMYNFRRISIQTALIVAVVLAGQTHSETTLDERVARLTELIEEQRKLYKIPGLAIAVVQDGKTILARGFGVKNIEKQLAVSEKTIFPIESLSKPFTAIVAGIRVDEGVIDWDDLIVNYLPDYRFRQNGKDLPITLRDALSHRTGYARNDTLWSNPTVSRTEIIRAAPRALPVAEHRTEFHYNNVMYLAAGMATAHDKVFNWESILQEKLLKPLYMVNTTANYLELSHIDNLATGYYWQEHDQTFYMLPNQNLNNIAPATGIYSNAKDLANWLSFLLNEGKIDNIQLIKPETLSKLFSPVITMSDTYSYGLGWYISQYNSETLLEHSGNGEGFSAQVALLPESGVGFALLMNVPKTPLQSASINLIFDTLLKALPNSGVDQTEQDYSKYVGDYVANFWQFQNSIFTFKVHGGKPALNIPSQTLYMLNAPDEQGKLYFEVTDKVAISFNVDEQNQIVSMNHHEEGQNFVLPKKEQEGASQNENNTKSRDKAQTLSELMKVAQQILVIEKLGKINLKGSLFQEQSGISGRFEMGVSNELDWNIKQNFGQFGYIETRVAAENGINKRLRHSYQLKGMYYEQALREHPFNFLHWDRIYKNISINNVKEDEKSVIAVLEGFYGSDATVLINKETGHTTQIDMHFVDPVWGEYPRSISYSDYIPFCGLNIPRKFEINDHETGNTVFKVTDITTEFCSE